MAGPYDPYRLPAEAARHPIDQLSDYELFHELEQLYLSRLETLRRGSQAALENSDRRIRELESLYLRRHPEREVSPRRIRPDDDSLFRPTPRPGQTPAAGGPAPHPKPGSGQKPEPGQDPRPGQEPDQMPGPEADPPATGGRG